jgi:hypothetical protein
MSQQAGAELAVSIEVKTSRADPGASEQIIESSVVQSKEAIDGAWHGTFLPFALISITAPRSTSQAE